MISFSMDVFLLSLIPFCVSMILHIPMLRMPLSEDDGNWFYQAVFWRRGIRPYKNLFNQNGYFSAHWVLSKLYNILPSRKLSAFYLLKSVWYALNAVSVFYLTQCLWHDTTLSLIASLIFCAVTALPNTLFMLTYGEHFYILPVNLSIIAVCMGFTEGDLFYFAIAGFFCGWAFQIKPTVLLWSLVLSLCLFLSPSPYTAFAVYWSAFIALTLLPIALIARYGTSSWKGYLRTLFGDTIMVCLIAGKRAGLTLPVLMLEKIFSFLDRQPDSSSYVKKHHEQSRQTQWAKFRQFILPSAKDLEIVIFLALIQIVSLAFVFDPMVVAVTGLLCVSLATIFVQKNYYTPHLNPIWIPLSILAAKSIWDAGPYLLHSKTPGLFMLAVLAIESIKILRIHINSFRFKDNSAFGAWSPWHDLLFGSARTIGEYIKNHSGETEKLLVWGDMPSVYLYSQRESIHTNFLFLYGKQEKVVRLDELLSLLKEQPPELIQFCNWKIKDEWNMERLEAELHIPYTLIETFRITNDHGQTMRVPNGILCEFPLYRRNDAVYREILLDRALIGQYTGSYEEARDCLSRIVSLFPDFYEAALRLTLLGSEPDTQLATLEKTLSMETDEKNQGVILRLIADIWKKDEGLDKAADYYSRGISINPTDFRSLNGLGELIYLSGDTQRAEALFHDAHAINPYSADILNNLGVLYLESGRFPEAEKLFISALEVQPGHADSWANLSQVLAMEERST